MPWEFWDRPATQVEHNLAGMNVRADAMIAHALSVVTALGNVPFELNSGEAPNIDMGEIQLPDIVTPQPPKELSSSMMLGAITAEFEDLSRTLGVTLADLDINVPDFTGSIATIHIPDAPANLDVSGAPTRPVTDAITIPEAPSITLPAIDALTAIDIPDFTFPTLPTFDAEAPVFDGVAPSTTLLWESGTYASAGLTEVQARVHLMLLGGTGLPIAVQNALFDAARTRETMTALAAKQEAFDDFAGRGFGMPPGMLVKLVEAASEKNQLEANALERDIFSKAAVWEIENLRFAVEKGIAIEAMLISMWQSIEQRIFDAAKAQLDGEFKLFDASISLFNARQQAFQTFANVYKTRLEGALAVLEVYKAQIQGAIAKGQLNEQVVKVYLARMEGVKMIIELYKGRMEGAQIQANIAKTSIEAFKADVDAYDSRLRAQKTTFDAYESRIKGEQVKAQVFEAEARAYGETVRAAEARGNIKIAFINAKINAMKASVDKYSAIIGGQRDKIRAELDAHQANTQAYVADIQRYTAEMNSQSSTRESTIRVSESRLRNQLAYYEARLKEYDATLARALERTKIIVEALKAAGQMTSSLAAGAMSAIHVSAGMSATASVSDSVTNNTTITRQGADTA